MDTLRLTPQQTMVKNEIDSIREYFLNTTECSTLSPNNALTQYYITLKTENLEKTFSVPTGQLEIKLNEHLEKFREEEQTIKDKKATQIALNFIMNDITRNEYLTPKQMKEVLNRINGNYEIDYYYDLLGVLYNFHRTPKGFRVTDLVGAKTYFNTEKDTYKFYKDGIKVA